jgi:glutamate N-acetyltransferase/amino-acid N-acetyltransferase
MKINNNGVTQPKGFLACGQHTGIKNKRKDLAIIYSEVPANFAGVFTTNIVKAAPVLRNLEIREKSQKIQAVVVNSGNANACTGEQGLLDNQKMADTVAKIFNIDECMVITASTGVIGVPLPIDKIVAGIKKSNTFLSNDRQGAIDAAAAIMTTDTVPKEVSAYFKIDGKEINIGGMAKGSGMIHPNMATMLSFITTDLAISTKMLQKAMSDSTLDSYNMISVDGDTSTNDMVSILANGMAGNKEITEEDENYEKFKEVLDVINKELAKMIVKDGEGATKLLEVKINGAKAKDDARKMCKSIINSSLVKTAFFGEDANWGRILCSMGYSGADFDPTGVSLEFKSKFGSIKVMENGVPLNFNEEIASEVLKEFAIEVNITLTDGDAFAEGWGCDMSYEYVRINGDYRS